MLNKMTKILVLMFLLCLISSNSIEPIRLLQSESQFNKTIQSNELVIVYFYTHTNCQFCAQFNQSYSLLSLLMQDKSQLYFAKINYEENEKLFSRLKVEGVPQIRFYRKGSEHVARFSHLEYDHSCVDELIQWVKRLTGSLSVKAKIIEKRHSGGSLTWLNDNNEEKEKNSAKKEKHQDKGKRDRITFNCNKKNAIKAFEHSQIYYQLLDVDFECGQSGRIMYKNKQNTLNQNNRLEICEKSIEQQGVISPQCERTIYNIKNRGVQLFSHSNIHNLFHQQNNQGLFVLITNNDTESIKYLRIYERIKHNWDVKNIVHQKKEAFKSRHPEINALKRQPFIPIFSVADIAMDISSPFMRDIISSSVHKLKRFIGGYQYVGWPYPFPILAYLKTFQLQGEYSGEQQLQKYIFRTKTLKKMIDEHILQENQQSGTQNLTNLEKQIQQWMKNVIVAPQNQSYRRSEKELSVGDSQSERPDEIQTEINEARKGEVNRMYRMQIQKIVAKLEKTSHYKPISICYIMVYWRNDAGMQKIKSQFDAWWHDHYKRYGKPFFLLDLYENDLPQGIHITHLPALIELHGDHSHTIHKIDHLKDVPNIFEDAYNRDTQILKETATQNQNQQPQKHN